MRPAVAFASAYFIGGIAVWISFARTNPDGLANIGLVLYVSPVTILGMIAGRLMGHSDFLLIPSRFGYLANHAVFFFPSLLVVTGLIGWAVSAFLRRARRRRSQRS